MEGLKDFVDNVPNFDDMNEQDQIDAFVYYLQVRIGAEHFETISIARCYSHLRIHKNISIDKYLKKHTSGDPTSSGKQIKFIATSAGYTCTRIFEKELRKMFDYQIESSFINFTINESSFELKPSEIPFVDNGTKKNAVFFTKNYFLFYHLENSIRKFLRVRLATIFKDEWQTKLFEHVSLKKAKLIRDETDLSNTIAKRGEDILYYCMWDDYGEIIRAVNDIVPIKERDELLSHLSTMTKIRNAIAHNVETIPKQYQDELQVFVHKYVLIIKQFTKQ